MKKLVYIGAILALVIGIVVTRKAHSRTVEDLAAELLETKRHSVVMITPPSSDNTGCSGFVVRALSGKIVTVTNRHCTDMAENGMLAAHYVDSAVVKLLRILYISETTDVAILEEAPGLEPFETGDGMRKYQRIHVLGFPYLNPLTYSGGFTVSEEQTMIATELPKSQCDGPGRKWMRVETFLGEAEVCVEIIHAYSTNVIVYPGNSGSVVLNNDGRAIGVVFAGNTRTNNGSIIPYNDLMAILALF
jgi:S1-C subfamily serine protease